MMKYYIFQFLVLLVLPLQAAYAQYPAYLKNDIVKISMDPKVSIALFDKQHEVEWASPFSRWIGLSDGNSREKIPLSNAGFEYRVYSDSIMFSFKGISGN